MGDLQKEKGGKDECFVADCETRKTVGLNDFRKQGGLCKVWNKIEEMKWGSL